MKVFTNPELLQMVKADREAHLLALNGLYDNVPEPLKTTIGKLRDDLNGKLATMLPLDQVPAAEQANYALNRLVDYYTYAQDALKEVWAKVNKIMGDSSTLQVTLNGLQDRITKGELLEKAKVDGLVEKAKNDGIASVLPQITEMRKSQIMLAGLPVAPDDVLALPVADFKTRFDGAVEQVQQLAAKGMTLANKGKAWVESCAWLPTVAFNGELAKIDAFDTKSPGDPLLGKLPEDKPADTKAKSTAWV